MSRRWDGTRPTLAERSGRAEPDAEPDAKPLARLPATAEPDAEPDAEPLARLPAPAEPDRVRPVTTRHCWVAGLPDAPGRHAGLLVEWRREHGESGWLARVVYVVDEPGSVLVEAWLPAGHLRPAR